MTAAELATPTRGTLEIKRRLFACPNLTSAIRVGAARLPRRGKVFKEGTMLESRRLAEPVEKPSRLQLAITEWQRELVERAKVMHGDRREPAGVTADEF
jgi:hypothetical protein